MTTMGKTQNANLEKRWVIIVGIFLIVQVIFTLIDGTFLEPNINDSGNLIPRIARWILDLKLFTEWITPYSYPFFNLFTTIHVIAILIPTVKDFISSMYTKR